ncbi:MULTISPECIES: ATP-binding cassette domain-containing protein [Vagococcus]|uniref:Methionine ABC transporter ATP-binding protein n=1 Tax=Vagococcus fluvialis bH819 TaxID=1255619 RepID=A0A1X6WPA3_9ENTE|nr:MULTISPECIES: ATP-binding cassette domain-containing protein [Vagococcus]SLM86087.1 Methionine ABC transporter ATP-binding protein [Vagococcus fluvialis bH819]HCM90336.1 metal ABC transporter ATP-binding protein [Vagococcus sp.]
MIELRNVSKQYDGFQVLNSINLKIEKQEIVGIVGESGSGKSTLLRIIQLMENFSAGDLLLDNHLIKNLSKSEIREQQRKMSLLFQQFNLLNNLTVIDNVHLPLKLQGKKEIKKAKKLLNFVGLAEKINDYPSSLSGGQKQRVALARALITNPKVLLLDEATSALDEQTTREMIMLIEKVHQEFLPTIVFVSHDLNAIKHCCDRVFVMEQGKVVSNLDIKRQSFVTHDESYPEKAKRVLSQ